MAADREALAAERRDFVASPPAQIRRTSEKVPLEKRHLGFRIAERIYRSNSRLTGGDNAAGQRSVQPQFRRQFVVVVRAGEPSTRLLQVNRRHVALFRV